MTSFVKVLLFGVIIFHFSDIALAKKKYDICFLGQVKTLSPIFACRIAEWIEYHLALGVDKVFMIDDCSPVDLNPLKQFVCSPEGGNGCNSTSRVEWFSADRILGKECGTFHSQLLRLTSSVYKNEIKDQCQWVGKIDVDEFISAKHDPYQDLRQEFRDFVFSFPPSDPVIRFAWWVMGSEGKMNISTGTVLENSHQGKLEPKHVKSIGNVQNITGWSFPLYPDVLNDTKTFAHGMRFFTYVRSFNLHPFEAFEVTLGGPDQQRYKIPAARFFIKHYMYNSFEEFMSQRAAQKATAIGSQNIWGHDAQTKWLLGNFTDNINIGSSYTSKMASVLRSILEKKQYQQEHDKHQLMDYCRRIWSI